MNPPGEMACMLRPVVLMLFVILVLQCPLNGKVQGDEGDSTWGMKRPMDNGPKPELSNKDEGNIKDGASEAGELDMDKLHIDDTTCKEMINKGAGYVVKAAKETEKEKLDWAKEKAEELVESGTLMAEEVTGSVDPKDENKGETAKPEIIGEKLITARSKAGGTIETAREKMVVNFEEPMEAGLDHDVTGRTIQAHFQDEL